MFMIRGGHVGAAKMLPNTSPRYHGIHRSAFRPPIAMKHRNGDNLHFVGVEADGERPAVNKGDAHHGTEASCRYR